MARSRREHQTHLQLVHRAEPPPVLTSPAARAEFEQLTQALLDAVIEIMDLADGEPDLEASGEEFEDGDGI